jgi:hypothetical protein
MMASPELYSDIPADTLRAARLHQQDPLTYWQQAYPAADEVRVDSTEIEGKLFQIPVIRSDSEMMNAGRDAFVRLFSKIVEKQYTKKLMGTGQIVPIDASRDGVSTLIDGTEVIEIVQTDNIGSMAAITDYSSGGPSIEVTMERSYSFVKMIGAKVIYSFAEVQKSLIAGMPLDSRKLAAMKESYVKYLDYGGYFGDAALGLQGVLTINGSTEYTSAARIVLGLPADQMLAILADIASTIPENTNNIEQPKRLVTTQRVMRAALNTRLDNNSKTVYEAFMEVEARIGGITEWIVDEKLKGIDNGNDIALVLPVDIDKLSLKVSTPYTQLDEQQINMAFVVHAYAGVGLIICTAPQAVMKVYDL